MLPYRKTNSEEEDDDLYAAQVLMTLGNYNLKTTTLKTVSWGTFKLSFLRAEPEVVEGFIATMIVMDLARVVKGMITP